MLKRLTVVLLTICLVSYSWSYAYDCVAVDSISVAFSPKAGAEELILYGIEVAEQSVKVAAYSFTSKKVSLALLEAHNRGVAVEVIVDAKSGRGRHSTAIFLADNGVPVRLNNKYAIFHHKFMLIDDKHVQTGSFNYSSAAARRNAENVVIIWDNPNVIGTYIDKWLELWHEGEELVPVH